MRSGNRRRQLARRRDVAAQHVGERVAPLLAGEPAAGSRRPRRPTASSTGDAAFTTTTIARVRRGDRADELVLRRRAAPSTRGRCLRSPSRCRCRRRTRRRRRRRASATARSIRSAGAGGRHPISSPPRPRRRHELDLDRVRLARASARSVPVSFRAAEAHERVAAAGRVPVVDHDLAVEQQARPADLHERERPLARLGRDDRAR